MRSLRSKTITLSNQGSCVTTFFGSHSDGEVAIEKACFERITLLGPSGNLARNDVRDGYGI
jgi:hypothetical protein